MKKCAKDIHNLITNHQGRIDLETTDKTNWSELIDELVKYSDLKVMSDYYIKGFFTNLFVYTIHVELKK